MAFSRHAINNGKNFEVISSSSRKQQLTDKIMELMKDKHKYLTEKNGLLEESKKLKSKISENKKALDGVEFRINNLMTNYVLEK